MATIETGREQLVWALSAAYLVLVHWRTIMMHRGVDRLTQVSPAILGFALGFGGLVVIVLTNVITTTLPDGNGEMAIILCLLLLYFGAAGYLAVRRTGSILHAVVSGAIVALIAMAMAWLAFLVVDNLFLAIVSQQADKIYGFQHSHFHSMRDYINAGLLNTGPFLVGVSTVIGAVCGGIGGLLAVAPVVHRRLRHRMAR